MCSTASLGTMVTVIQEDSRLRTLCVGRHPYLSDHIARFFTELGVNAQDVVGLDQAVMAAREFDPEIVICEYELLATIPLDALETDELLSRRPVIAVSLTRRPHEAHLMDVNGIGGFLYLPLLDRDAAMRLISAAAAASRSRYESSPAATASFAEAYLD
ncbi:MAG: hypothetical protein ABI681_13890 [Gemmatimonadales bacterium]